jgi:hypothetical protein
MSMNYDIACRDCGKHLWIGQRNGGSKGTVYTEDKQVMHDLGLFLFAHVGHRLVFDYNEVLAHEDETRSATDCPACNGTGQTAPAG